MNKEDQDLIIKNGEPRSGIFLNKPAYYVGIENLVNAKQLWSLRDFLRYMKDYFLKEDEEKKDELFKKHLIESVDINIDELVADILSDKPKKEKLIPKMKNTFINFC